MRRYQRGGHWNHPFLHRETYAHWRVLEVDVVTTRYRAAQAAAAAAAEQLTSEEEKEENTQPKPPPPEQAEMAFVDNDSGIGSLHAHDEKEPTPAIAVTLGMRTIAIKHDKVEYVLDKPIGVIPNKESPEFATFDAETHQKHIDNASDAQCVMLSSMSFELQRQHVFMFPYKMLKHLESLYASQAQTMEYEILRDLFKCKLHDGSKSLPSSFENFIVNFNMNNTKVGLPELHNRLKTYESSTAKT
ncbi:hypothetical protein SASPL_127278 [Salvia splendens]|uniref:Uncharacterized protein n=1 Tax=Salvia splendens TaxID=180675 RepID=A0A8X8ZRH9_SALSN|nr:hypothetical protein SASPL_127278 [Salvia splendens]